MLRAEVWVTEVYPKLSQDPYDDFDTSWDKGTVRCYLMRSTSGGIEGVPLPMPDGDFSIETPGIDLVEETDNGQWEATIYDAEISRDSVSPEDVRAIMIEEDDDNNDDDAPSSANYKARRFEGWVVGSAKYASTEPHHGRHYNYEEMYDPHREAVLTVIIEGRTDTH